MGELYSDGASASEMYFPTARSVSALASSATRPWLPLDPTMDKPYQETPLPNGVAYKIYGFSDDVKRKEKIFNILDQYSGQKITRTSKLPQSYKIEQKNYNKRKCNNKGYNSITTKREIKENHN